MTRQELKEKCIRGLGAAVQSHANSSGEVGEVCGHLALAIGRCRIFGVEPPDDLQFSLGVPAVIVACQWWTETINDWTSRIFSGWKATWKEHLRVWQSFLAIDEGYQAGIEHYEAWVGQVQPVVATLIDAMDAFDRDSRGTGLGESTESTEWRLFIAEPFRLNTPWWMTCPICDGAGRVSTGEPTCDYQCEAEHGWGSCCCPWGTKPCECQRRL